MKVIKLRGSIIETYVTKDNDDSNLDIPFSEFDLTIERC